MGDVEHLDDALYVFGRLCVKCRDVVSWSAMIAALAQHSLCDEAMALFHEMRNEGTEHKQLSMDMYKLSITSRLLPSSEECLKVAKNPINFTYMSVLKSCSALAALGQGKFIHADCILSGN